MMEIGRVFAEGESFGGLGLREELVYACRKLGWTTPTVIQAQAIPHALQGSDLIGLAQTGSGKTGAFVLPILQKLMDNPQPFFACIVAPTRELADQISKDVEALGSCIGIKTAVIMGGTSKMDQAIALAKRPHILVATPGRLLDHLLNTNGFSLKVTKYLVLDEADKLLNADFEQVINDILKVIPRERTTFLFSATMTEKVRKLKRACLRNPVKVEAASKYATNDTLKQQFVLIPAKQKDLYLVYILKKMVRCTSIVFTQTCDSTRLLALTLQNLGLKAVALHGQMKEEKRLGAMEKFKVGECNILVCTDVGSRGLDLEVDIVINYDIPRNSKDYCHRVGRTARAGRSGIAISLVNQFEVEWFSLIEKHIKKKLQVFPADESEVELLSEDVTEAKRSARMTIQESAGNKKRQRKKEEGEEFEINIGRRENAKKIKSTKRK